MAKTTAQHIAESRRKIAEASAAVHVIGLNDANGSSKRSLCAAEVSTIKLIDGLGRIISNSGFDDFFCMDKTVNGKFLTTRLTHGTRVTVKHSWDDYGGEDYSVYDDGEAPKGGGAYSARFSAMWVDPAALANLKGLETLLAFYKIASLEDARSMFTDYDGCQRDRRAFDKFLKEKLGFLA